MVHLSNAYLWAANIEFTLPFPELDGTCLCFTTQPRAHQQVRDLHTMSNEQICKWSSSLLIQCALGPSPALPPKKQNPAVKGPGEAKSFARHHPAISPTTFLVLPCNFFPLSPLSFGSGMPEEAHAVFRKTLCHLAAGMKCVWQRDFSSCPPWGRNAPKLLFAYSFLQLLKPK